jgi:hypothetical protein
MLWPTPRPVRGTPPSLVQWLQYGTHGVQLGPLAVGTLCCSGVPANSVDPMANFATVVYRVT